MDIINSPALPLRRRSVIAAALILTVGIFIGRYLLPAFGPMQFVTVKNGQRELIFPTFWEAKDQLEAKFIGEPKDADLFYGAIRGMIAAANDPYTVFSNPSDTQLFEETIEGSFSGVGIEIGIRQGLITVIAPLDGSPAELAGIRESDIIVAVDQEPITADQTLDSIVQAIRGPRHSTVVLTVIHKDERDTQDITVRRDTIEVESVKLKIEEGIAHLAITSFNGDTADRAATAARTIKQAGVRGVILDVRSNPGGFLQSAVDIASFFLPPGTLVVSEKGKDTTQYQSSGVATLAGLPVVVLVNEGSASASEILAGALADQVQAPLIGQKTFGKGSVQEFIKLRDGSSLRITVARWFTPNDHNIDANGIEPSIVVEDNPDTPEDEQLQRAKEEFDNE